MKKTIFIVISVIIGLLVYQKSDEIIIPSDAIRIRIIANGNNIKDLYEKQLLKDEVKNDLYNLIIKANSSIEANDIIINNLGYIRNIVDSRIKEANVTYGINYFPRKEYKGVIYPAGDYKSLVITLGAGLGDNWWCVLYPPICMINDNQKTGDVEYRLLVSNLLNN